MKREELFGFIGDSAGFTLAFLFNSFIIIFFYHITTNGAAEIIYPILISFTIYLIYMFFRAMEYFNFIKSLKESMHSINFNYNSLSYSKNLVFKTLDFQFNKYMNELSIVSSKMKSFRQFFSQWIHDMKTPVSVMELVMQNNDITEISDLKKELKEEILRLTDDLEKALSFIRLEDFEKDYLPEKVDLKEIVSRIINKKRREFIYNRVFPQIICNEDNTNILTDLKWNEFIIEQLTNNAIKYSKAEKENKNLYYIISKSDDNISLTIKDEGMGIPEQDRRRIFEPFFTGENGRKVNGSSGVGLYLIKEISNKLNHKINVNSKVGEGSEFTMQYITIL
ncbi:sensor histidine kinase [Oceanirhabdus sp. W0125-5]|uniref:sensor histidine kinase n=1 Tax=Oceanirhabdus sp. W0125-5 TaxID=2999116 RepID=UPI0022F2F720|nr:sensor histidine kinase [Oceanirhabdus sp. W0125-5]WBW97254.1 sensor histidine kinase [Oceanirhabdus sp. W0125-5]